MRPRTASRRLLGSVLLVLGLVTMLAARPGSADAGSVNLRAADPSALSVLLSRTVVAGKAEAILVAADNAPAKLAGVGSALGALPGQVPLLLTPAGRLSPAVAAEVDRIRTASTVAYVLDDAGVAAALAARGLTVNLVVPTDSMDLSAALAQQTYGVLGGTGQRLIVTAGDLRVAGIAGAFGANLGIPVLMGSGAHRGEVFLREVLVIADPAVLPDEAVGPEPGPRVTRIWDADLDALGVALGARLAAEPRDGDLAERAGRSIIVLDRDERDPHPALLAPVLAAAQALDGFDATVRVLETGAVVPDADGLVVFSLGLGNALAGARPSSSPLPATGGGLALGAGLALSGWVLRRR